MLDNGDGTVSPVDMTEYETAGDKFGAKDVNAITKMVNCTGDAFDPERDYEVGDYAIHENTVWKFTTAHPAGAWDESHVEKTRILVEIAEQNKNFADLNEKILIPKRLPTGDLNDAYPSSVGITIYICISTDKNIPVNDTGFVESIKYDDNAKIQLFYSLNNNNVYKRKDVGKWSTV